MCITHAVSWIAAGAVSMTGFRAIIKGLHHKEDEGLPRVVSRDQWVRARKELLIKEKEWSRQRAAQAAERRKLPMVLVDKDYAFDGPGGRRSLLDLFGGKRQLIVYHFMFGTDWNEGCPACSFVADHFDGVRPHLAARDTAFAVISRAPLEKLEGFRERMGWRFPWLSSAGSDFNYDFHVTTDENHRELNYRDYFPIAGEMASKHKGPPPGEGQGLSVFLRAGDRIYHAYSTFQRGLDPFINTYNFLDHTPLGRQETGLPMDWINYHDKYQEKEQ